MKKKVLIGVLVSVVAVACAVTVILIIKHNQNIEEDIPPTYPNTKTYLRSDSPDGSIKLVRHAYSEGYGEWEVRLVNQKGLPDIIMKEDFAAMTFYELCVSKGIVKTREFINAKISEDILYAVTKKYSDADEYYKEVSFSSYVDSETGLLSKYYPDFLSDFEKY